MNNRVMKLMMGSPHPRCSMYGIFTFGQSLWENRPYIEHLGRFPGSYGVLEPLKFLFKHVSIAYSETDKHCMPRMLTLHFNMFFVVLQVSMFF